MSKIKTASAIDIVSKTSNKADGKGTIIIARIAITNITTLKSFWPKRKFIAIADCCLNVGFLAKKSNLNYSKISARVSSAKNKSILPWSLFKNGHILQIFALLDGQSSLEGAHSKTAGALPSTADISSSILMFLGNNARENPPRTPLKDLSIPFFAKAWRIFAKKLFGIESSRESVSLSIGASALESTIKERMAYSLARVININ